MADGTPRRLCESHSPFSGANFCGEGTGPFRSSGEQIWKSTRTNTKLLGGVIGPKFTPNDYLNTRTEYAIVDCFKCNIGQKKYLKHQH